MGHAVRMFVGPRSALRPFAQLAPVVRAYGLTPAAALFALPLTDDVHDALHAAYGTGEWLDFAASPWGPRLTTTDMTFAARASAAAPLVWLETDYSRGRGTQSAAAFIDGALHMTPGLLGPGEHRPWPLRPINSALRLLGVKATGPGAEQDEFAVFGLPHYRSNEAIVAHAVPVVL